MAVVAHVAHLPVEMHLYPAVVVYLVLMLFYKSFEFFGGVFGHVAPCGEVGRAIGIAEHAICRIGYEPGAVGVDECLEIFRFHCLGAILGEEFAGICVFGVVDFLVIHILQSVELSGYGVVVGLALGILEASHLAKAQVHGVQSEGRVGVVGVGVGPGVGHCGVVDREHLDEFLACGGRPVGHFHQVEEFAYAEIILGAEREYGDGHAGAAPGCFRVDKAHPGHNHAFAFGGRHVVEMSVGASLPYCFRWSEVRL